MIYALRYTKLLVENGFTEDQANIALKVGLEIMNENFATKKDIQLSELALKSDMKEMESSIRSDMKEEFANVRSEMKDMESRLNASINNITLRLGSLMVVLFGMTISILKFV